MTRSLEFLNRISNSTVEIPPNRAAIHVQACLSPPKKFTIGKTAAVTPIAPTNPAKVRDVDRLPRSTGFDVVVPIIAL